MKLSFLLCAVLIMIPLQCWSSEQPTTYDITSTSGANEFALFDALFAADRSGMLPAACQARNLCEIKLEQNDRNAIVLYAMVGLSERDRNALLQSPVEIYQCKINFIDCSRGVHRDDKIDGSILPSGTGRTIKISRGSSTLMMRRTIISSSYDHELINLLVQAEPRLAESFNDINEGVCFFVFVESSHGVVSPIIITSETLGERIVDEIKSRLRALLLTRGSSSSTPLHMQALKSDQQRKFFRLFRDCYGNLTAHSSRLNRIICVLRGSNQYQKLVHDALLGLPRGDFTMTVPRELGPQTDGMPRVEQEGWLHWSGRKVCDAFRLIVLGSGVNDDLVIPSSNADDELDRAERGELREYRANLLRDTNQI